MPAPIDARFDAALAHHQAGRLAEAAQGYADILQQVPDHFDAQHLLGVILLQAGDAHNAERMIGRALLLSPERASALANHGLALDALGRVEEALARYDAAIAVKPDFTDALAHRARALRRLGRQEAALTSADQALATDPRHAGALTQRAALLMDARRFEDALDTLDRLLAVEPARCATLIDRGNALFELGLSGAAIEAFDQALTLDPRNTGALNNRGLAMMRAGQDSEALACFDQALAVDPSHIDALNNRSQLLMRLHRYPAALTDLDRLLALAPDLPYAAGNALTCRLHLCDWQGLEASRAALTAGVRAGRPVISPFQWLAVSGDAALQLACARASTAGRYPARAPAMAAGGSAAVIGARRLRIAYLSADFHRHATAALATGVFEHHDRARFETIAVSFGPDDGSPERARLIRAFDSFLDVSSLPDGDVAARIAATGVDIAVDLKGYTQAARPGILAWRPAPVQVGFLGYPGTLGAPWLDYLIADRMVAPPGSERFYAEALIRMPDSYQPNDDRRTIDPIAPERRACGLPDDGFVFCCFNNGYKIVPPMFDVWMRILARVERSVLWLLIDDPDVIARLRGEAAARHIAPNRLVFAPRIDAAAHLARHRLADLSLDTLPINAHTTASDALWAGLPLLTCAGEAFASRVAASLLDAAGLPELITTTLTDYEAKAVQLAGSPSMLRELRERLASRRASMPLFDTRSYTRHLEQAYLRIAERHRRGLAPTGIDLAG